MLTNMSGDILTVSQLSVGRHVDRPSTSTDTWPRGAQTSQELHPLQNYHPCHLGNLAVLDQIVSLTGTNL